MSEEKQVGFASIAIERIEQVEKHKRELQQDRGHKKGELLSGAKFCETLDNKDWPKGWMISVRENIKSKSEVERLIIRAAFIAAEIDRLNGIDDWRFSREAERYSEWSKLIQYVAKKQVEISHCFSGNITEKVTSLISHSSWKASQAIADKKDCIEKMKIYLQAMKMLAEGVGMASTHGEKASRLRGMIEVMNSTIDKLNNEHQDEILTNWSYGLHSHSDFPYRDILQKYEQMKLENEQLKKQINGAATHD